MADRGSVAPIKELGRCATRSSSPHLSALDALRAHWPEYLMESALLAERVSLDQNASTSWICKRLTIITKQNKSTPSYTPGFPYWGCRRMLLKFRLLPEK